MPLFLIASRLVRRLNDYRVAALLGLAVTIVIVGGALFSLTQHISLGLGLYWSVTTATTVGYGDITPHNTAGRIVAMAVMLTTIPIVGAVFALVAGASVVSRLRRLIGMDTRPPTGSYTAVYGDHPVLPRIMAELADSGDEVVLIAAAKPPGLPEDFHFIAGTPTDEKVIARSDPAKANRALIACQADSDTLVVAVAIHHLAPDLEVHAITQSLPVARALRELGVTYTVSSDSLVGHTVAKSLETPAAGILIREMVASDEYRLVETAVDPSLVSQKLSAARARPGTLVLGLCQKGKVDLGVNEDPVLDAGDTLIVLQPVPREPAHHL
jgi:voltage-gated potassium channel